MAATSQAQAEATKAAQIAGIAHAKADATKYRGKKPSFSRETFEAIQAMLKAGTHTATHIANVHGVKRQTVYRIEKEPETVETALNRWGM